MKKVWYLFEEVEHYFGSNDEFVECAKTYYLYNIETEEIHAASTSLQHALNNGVQYRKVEFLFSRYILKGQVPLFEPCNNHGMCYDYETIKNALPKIKNGETFVNEAAVFSYDVDYDKYIERYSHHADPLKHYVKLLQEYKDCKKNNKQPVNLTKGEIKPFERDYNIFLDVTLLHASKDRPTVDDIKMDYPELL